MTKPSLATHRDGPGNYFVRTYPEGEHMAGPFETGAEATAWRDGYWTALGFKKKAA